MKPWSPFVVVSCTWLGAFAAVSMGCGSSVETSTFDDPTDGSAADGSGSDGNVSDGSADDTGTTNPDDTSAGDDTKNPGNDGGNPNKDTGTPATDTAPPTDITLDNVCGKLADVICSKAQQTCCTSKSVDYKADGCRTAVSTFCGNEVTQVKAGNGTFNANAFAACAAAWPTLQTKCTIPVLDYVETYAPCQQLFPGTVAPGGMCTEDSDCKVKVGALGSCETVQTAKRCSETVIAADGQPCDYEGSTRAFCDYGLQCQFAGGATGTCRPAKKIGDACTGFECGFGNYCNRAAGSGSGVCAVGLAAGATCTVDAVCASANCRSGACTDPNVTVAIPFFCSGTP